MPATDQLADADPSLAWVRWIPSMIALAACTPLSLLVARRFAWFTADDHRLAIPLGLLAIGYAVATPLLKEQAVRILATALAVLGAVAAVAIAAPDGSLLVFATSTAAVSSFVIAVVWRAAPASAVSWLLILVTVVIAARRVGLEEQLLHIPFLVTAMGLVLVSSAGALLLRGRDQVRPWFLTAGVVGSTGVAVGLLEVGRTDAGLWAWGLGAAIATVAFIIAFGYHWLVSVAWGYLLVSYLDAFWDAISADAVWLVPFAAVMAGTAAVLPGRRSWNVTTYASPVTVLGGLAVLAASMLWAVVQGDASATFAWSAMVIASLAPIQRREAWLHVASGVLIVAGVASVGPWLSMSLAVVALLETILAVRHTNDLESLTLPWVSIALWGATLAAIAAWLELAAGPLVALALTVGILASLAMLTAWMLKGYSAWGERWGIPIALGGQAALVTAGAIAQAEFPSDDALIVWGLIAAVEALLAGIPGTMRTNGPAVWISATLGCLAVGMWIRGSALPDSAVVFLLLGIGAIGSVLGTTMWIRSKEGTSLRLWGIPLVLVAQAALMASAVQAEWSFQLRNAALVWATVLWVEAALVGTIATVKRLTALVWLSIVVIVFAGGLTLWGVDFSTFELVWTTGTLSVVILTVWVASIFGPKSARLAMWQLPMAALAQAAALTSGLAALTDPSVIDPYPVWISLLTIDALAVGVVGTATRTHWMAFGSTALFTTASVLAVQWRQPGASRVLMWLALSVAALATASVLTRMGASRKASLWTWPSHAAFTAYATLSVVAAHETMGDAATLRISAFVVALIALDLLVNRVLIGGTELPASVASVLAAGLLASSAIVDDRLTLPIFLGIGVVGALAAGAAGASEETRRTAFGIPAIGLSVIAAASTVATFDAQSAQLGLILLIIGAAFCAFAITGREPIAMHAAVFTWLAATLVLIDSQWSLNATVTVLAVAVVVLTMVEVERFRLRRAGQKPDEWLFIVEWLVMLAPLLMAARNMVAISMAYGLLLAGEGAALLAWGIVTQVRRRAVLGLAAATAAVLMAVMIPLIEGFDGTMSQGWWLLIGGIAAVSFITAGSVIEKYRTRIGERLTQFGTILERWE